MKGLIALLCGAILGMAMPVQAQIYRWVDENGVTHFSDKPPKDQRAERIGTTPAPSPSNSGGTASRHAYDPEKLRENERRYLEAVAAERRARERRKAEQEQQEAFEAVYCKELHQQLLNYREGFAMVRRNERGEIEYLPDQEIKNRHQELEALWQKRCSK